jgi:hypothetical protein
MRNAIFLLCLCTALPASTSAQTIDVPTGRPSVGFEILHPFYDDDDSGIVSGGYFVNGLIPVSSAASFRFEVPFAYLDMEEGVFDGGTSSSIGNPLLALSFQGLNMSFELGARPSLADDEELATIYAAFADMSRWEAFLPQLTSVFGQVRTQRISNGFGWALNFGPSLWIPTEDGESEIFVDYGGAVGYVDHDLRLTLRLKGKYVVTEDADDADFADRSVHQLGLFSEFGGARVRPAAHFLIHMDESYQPDVTLGLALKLASL